MKSKSLNNFIKNMSYSILSNSLHMIISVFMVIFLPHFFSINDYGMWQLYLFYISFSGFIPLGWLDGIYLRYGGEFYNTLDKSVFNTQFYSLLLYTIVFNAALLVYFYYYQLGGKFYYILYFLCLVSTLRILTGYFKLLLQAVNRIKDFAKIMIVEQITFFIGVIIIIFLGLTDYKKLLQVDLFSKILTVFFAIYICMDIFSLKFTSLKNNLKEIALNIQVGSKLMLANIASMLILGIVRFGISQGWDIATFGKVSLTLSVSNFMMVFISAISVIMFPVLKRIDQNKLADIYIILRTGLSIILLGMLTSYYPIKTALLVWLPKYADGLKYMAILFPICLFESKMSLLINTYLKSLRQEKLMLQINWVAVSLSLLLTYITVFVMHDLNLAVLSIVAVFAFRCILAEYFMGGLLNLKLLKDIVLEIALVILFILTSWFIDSWWCLVIYACGYIGYLVTKKQDVKKVFQLIKKVI